jgi:hypothetical protein
MNGNSTMTPRSGSTPLQWQGSNNGPSWAGGAGAWPSGAPVARRKRRDRLKGRVAQQRRSAQRTTEPVTKRTAPEGWPSTVDFLLADGHELEQRYGAELERVAEEVARQLSGSCPVGSPCDGSTDPLHPTIAELRQAVAADYEIVVGRGFDERQSLDGLIVLIGEQDHYRPDAATRAIESIWQPGDLHFVDLPDSQLRSGTLDRFLRGIPILQADAEGGSVSMDDPAVAERDEALMVDVADLLRELIRALFHEVRPGAVFKSETVFGVTLADLRRQRNDLWADYKRRPVKRNAQISALRDRLIAKEAALEDWIAATVPQRSDYMAKTVLDSVDSDRAAGLSPRRTYVAVPGAAHLQRMTEVLQKSGRPYVLLCPHAVSHLIDACR